MTTVVAQHLKMVLVWTTSKPSPDGCQCLSEVQLLEYLRQIMADVTSDKLGETNAEALMRTRIRTNHFPAAIRDSSGHDPAASSNRT